MEEAVGESESLISLSNLTPDEQTDEKRGDDGMGQEGGRSRNEADAVKGKESGEEGPEEERREEEEESGGSLIDHLISNLPVSVPDDVSPGADEASILISIARD